MQSFRFSFWVGASLVSEKPKGEPAPIAPGARPVSELKRLALSGSTASGPPYGISVSIDDNLAVGGGPTDRPSDSATRTSGTGGTGGTSGEGGTSTRAGGTNAGGEGTVGEGGSTGAGGGSNAGASTSSGGTATDGGVSKTAGASSGGESTKGGNATAAGGSSDEGGCVCQVPRSGGSRHPIAGIALSGLLLALYRRQRSSA